MCAWQRLSCFLMSMALISPLFTQTRYATTHLSPNLALYDLGPISSLCLSFPICKVDILMAPTLPGFMGFNITTCVTAPGLVCSKRSIVSDPKSYDHHYPSSKNTVLFVLCLHQEVCPESRYPAICLTPTCVHAQSLSRVQLFCNPMDCSPPGSSIRGISQARILEWVAISFSRGSS